MSEPARKPIQSFIPLNIDLNALAEILAERLRSSLASRVQPVLLTVKDAAVYLGRSEQAVQHLIFQRELPVVRVGRRVHLDRRDLDAWIEKHKV